jgi:hypothetical protein
MGGRKGLGMPRLIGREFVGKRDEMERYLGLVEEKRRGFGGMEVNRRTCNLKVFCCDFGKVQVCCRMYGECIVHGNCRSCKGRISARNHLPNYTYLPT